MALGALRDVRQYTAWEVSTTLTKVDLSYMVNILAIPNSELAHGFVNYRLEIDPSQYGAC